jgi:hypothetical protein
MPNRLLLDEKLNTVKIHYKDFQPELPDIIYLLYTTTIVTINDRGFSWSPIPDFESVQQHLEQK